MKKTLLEVLAQHGIDIVPDFTLAKQRNGSQWLFCSRFEIDGKTIEYASFGDFRTGLEGAWEGFEGDLTPAQEKEKQGREKENRVAREEMQLTLWEEARLEANRFLREECTDRGQPTPYLVRKKISSLHGAKVWTSPGREQVLIIPLRDMDGIIWSYQEIWPEKLPSGRDKNFQTGGRKKGCFYLFGSIEPEGAIYVCEGFATGASIYEAFNCSAAVVAALDAGNLENVGVELGHRFSATRIIFCADDDQHNKRRGTNVDLSTNTGIRAANRAASRVGGETRIPTFRESDLGTNPSDFNDLHALSGLTEVYEQIKNPHKYQKSLQPLTKYTKKGAPIEPTDQEVAKALLAHYNDAEGSTLIHQDDQFFGWSTTHWKRLNSASRAILWQNVAIVSGHTAATRKIDSALKYFRMHTPRPPTDIFVPNRFVTNFKNGTLFIDQENGKYSPRFVQAHKRADYITFCLPFDYQEDYQKKEGPFHEMLDRIWRDDPFSASKKLALQMFMGNCLCPAFPRIAFFVGGPGTGKSTLLKIIARLISDNNLSFVDPTEFTGFRLVEMVGKLVNLNSDISTTKPLSDSTLKKIVDQMPTAMDVKNRDGIVAPLPPVHAYAMNRMPKTFDAATGAYRRRISVFVVDRFKPEKNHDPYFDQRVWETDHKEIVAWACEGLRMLLDARGQYPEIGDAEEKFDAMEADQDPVSRFIGEVKEGYVSDVNTLVLWGEKHMTPRAKLWEIFQSWHQKESGKVSSMGKHAFFNALRRFGVIDYRDKTGRYFVGIGSVVNPDSLV